MSNQPVIFVLIFYYFHNDHSLGTALDLSNLPNCAVEIIFLVGYSKSRTKIEQNLVINSSICLYCRRSEGIVDNFFKICEDDKICENVGKNKLIRICELMSKF